MNFYGVVYFRNGKPDSRSYCFKSEDDYKFGDVVELPGRRKGLVVGDPAEDKSKIDESKIKTITGKWIADYEGD